MMRQCEPYSGVYVFEGIDNVGKTTIIKKLKEKIFLNIDYECVSVAFPGNESRTLGELVYDIHHNQGKYFDQPLNETSLQMLHVASHIDLVQKKLKKLSSDGDIVLLDRYWWSTYAYGLAGGLDGNIVQAVLEPELMCWKDINVKSIFLIERENRERDYDAKKDKKIIGIYRKLASKEPKSIIINNDGNIEDVVTQIYNNIVGV